MSIGIGGPLPKPNWRVHSHYNGRRTWFTVESQYDIDQGKRGRRVFYNIERAQARAKELNSFDEAWRAAQRGEGE